VYCRVCGRQTSAAEITTIYATDDETRPRIILPARLMPGVEETDDPTE